MMDAKRISVNLRVFNKAFGEGTIKVVYDKRESVTVVFDNAEFGQKDIHINYLFEIYNVEEVVFHKKHGKGIIFEYRGNNIFYVVFYNDYEGEIPGDELEPFHEEKIVEEIEEEQKVEEFRIIPSNYSEQSSFSTPVKQFLTSLKKKYSDGLAAIKSYEENGGNVGVFLVPNRGIVVFKMMSLEEKDIDFLYNKMYYAACKGQLEKFRAFYTDKMLMSKKLYWSNQNNTNKCFRYPTRFVFVFENIHKDKINKDKLALSDIDIFFKGFDNFFDNNDVLTNFEPYVESDFKTIEQELYGAIIERIIPEYSTLVDIVPQEKSESQRKKTDFKFAPITGKEREFRALSLDDEQIKIINDTKPGHYITLANPGTGKSVLLVSKAYRIKSANKDSKVLITCYNNNLMQHHSEFAVLSGMSESGLYIKTFHKLITQALEEENLYRVNHLNDDGLSSEFQKAIDIFEENYDAGKIKMKFDAIFIDEVQLFEPRWIDLCYKMLGQDPQNAVFELFGDINQNVREMQLKKKAPWQQLKLVPSFKGRYKKIVKNYRNTQRIAKYLNALITDFNDYLAKRGIQFDDEDMGMTTVFNDTLGEKVTVAISSHATYARIANLIKSRVNKGEAQYSDYAIIYPASKIKDLFSPIQLITDALDKNRIPYDFICGDIATKKKVFECTGVILTTIDSSLGLDFKHVIFCGLHFWDYFYNPETGIISNFTNGLLSSNPVALDKLSEIGKKIYSACSRARLSLEVMDDLDKDSPIRQILRPKNGKEYYNDK